MANPECMEAERNCAFWIKKNSYFFFLRACLISRAAIDSFDRSHNLRFCPHEISNFRVFEVTGTSLRRSALYTACSPRYSNTTSTSWIDLIRCFTHKYFRLIDQNYEYRISGRYGGSTSADQFTTNLRGIGKGGEKWRFRTGTEGMQSK